MKRWLFWILLVMPLLASQVHTNALIDEKSPYLQAHAHNPVNWYPYGEKAFQKAQKEDKLIFMSIGFSTCHWCHVMEHESFENEAIAALLNRDYVAIKVDKEESPQIDTYYQHLFSRLQHRRNGWPLSIIMTPDQKILYMTTYIPPQNKYGVEGMQTLLPKYARLYHTQKEKLAQLIAENEKKITRPPEPSPKRSDKNITRHYVEAMQQRFDRIYKGFDSRPRFPMAAYLSLLWEIYLLEGDQSAYTMVTQTLDAMATGGIYDQIEGGFFRYTTDQDWVIPHYEKMLYTNAQLLDIYIDVWKQTQKPLYQKIITETIAMYHRQLENNGLFYGATDADSMGEEGGYFTYRYSEVRKRLQQAGFGEDEIETLLEYFDILEPGNFKEDRSNVHFNTGFESEEIPNHVDKVRQILADMRKSRTFPFIDTKIITSWNAMMIKTLFKAAVIDKKYAKEATESLHALLARNRPKGVLYHYSIGTHPPTQKAFLEDFAFLIDALIAAYEYSYDPTYLSSAHTLTQEAIARFYDGTQWYINEGTPRVKTRYLDKYYSTPLARMFNAMLSLASLEYDPKLYHQVRKMVSHEKENIMRAFDRSPEALRALIRLGRGDIVLKAKKALLVKNRGRIAKIRYPFLLTKVEKTEMFLLCDMQSCFYYDKNLTKVIDKIETKKEKK